MFSTTFLLVACLATALATAAACSTRCRKDRARALLEERARHEAAEQQLRDEHAAALRALQESLLADMATLRERSRHPLKSLVGSLLG